MINYLYLPIKNNEYIIITTIRHLNRVMSYIRVTSSMCTGRFFVDYNNTYKHTIICNNILYKTERIRSLDAYKVLSSSSLRRGAFAILSKIPIQATYIYLYIILLVPLQLVYIYYYSRELLFDDYQVLRNNLM